MLERRLSGLVVLALAASTFALTGPRSDHAGASASAQASPPFAPPVTLAADQPASFRPAVDLPPDSADAAPQVPRPQPTAARGMPLAAPPAAPPAAVIRQIGSDAAPDVPAKHVEILDEATG